jgi:hypothetical protein
MRIALHPSVMEALQPLARGADRRLPLPADQSGANASHEWNYIPSDPIPASIYRNVFGLELRIDLAGELMHTQLSRRGEQPLILLTAPGTRPHERANAERLVHEIYWQVAASILTDSAFSLGAVTVADAVAPDAVSLAEAA